MMRNLIARLTGRSATARVVVDRAYFPREVAVPADAPARLEFLRQDQSSCTREVVFPSLGIRRELPTDQPVTIDLPALPAGTVEFHCGMGMVRGRVNVTPA